MKSLLHITNGDSFTSRLESLQLKGDIITWREMLCEGKTLCTVGSESFWKTRFEFLNKNYKITKGHYDDSLKASFTGKKFDAEGWGYSYGVGWSIHYFF